MTNIDSGKGLFVVELASVLAGPLVGSFFAEIGATVIKIENKKAGGDVTRQWLLPKEENSYNESAYYYSANYGKEVVMLDLSTEADRAIAYQYLKKADIVLSNFQKKVAEKLQLDYKRITSINPKVIFLQLNAYSYEDERPGYDLVMQAETGYISMTGSDETALAKMPVALIDILAAHQMKEAALLGLWHKTKTGDGGIYHVSLYQSAISALANQATNYLNVGHIAKPMGTQHPNIAPYGDYFYTQDGQGFMLAVGSDDQFSKLCQVLQLSEEKRKDFLKNQDRITNRKALVDILTEAIGKQPAVILFTSLEQNKIPFGRIKNMQEVFEEDLAKEMILEIKRSNDLPSFSISNIAFSREPPS